MSTSPPLVSIIIPFYNCLYVAQAIESVLDQTYSHIELIVVNDGSTINKHLIDPYLPKIKYIEQVNKGVAAALNEGIKQAKGEYLVWLSSDDLIAPNKIKVQLGFMEKRMSLISFTNFNVINEENKVIIHNAGNNFLNELEVLQTFLESCPINGCTVMMSRKIIERIGYFNEELKYAQDYEYWIRVALLFPIHYLPETLTYYRYHQSMGSVLYQDDQMREFHNVKDKYTLSIKDLISKKRTSET